MRGGQPSISIQQATVGWPSTSTGGPALWVWKPVFLSRRSIPIGDTVIIGVREDLLVRSSLLVYLFPLLGLFAAALLADGLGLSEPLVILVSLIGLCASWLMVRWRAARVAENPLLQPVVLRALLVPVPAAG